MASVIGAMAVGGQRTALGVGLTHVFPISAEDV